MQVASWSWPNLFDISKGEVNLYRDTRSIVNRVKLLLLTEPTELYMCPNFGVGLKKFIFKYNNENVVPMIRDKLVEQLRLWEPRVIPEDTKVERGLKYTMDPNKPLNRHSLNELELTVTLTTSFMQTVGFNVTGQDLQ